MRGKISAILLMINIALIGCGGGGGGETIPTTPLSIPGKTYGSTGNDYAWSVQQTIDGGYIFAGSTNSSGAGGYDGWVVKTDASGNVAREKTFGTSGNDFAFSVQQTSDGGYIVAGVDNSSNVLSPGGFFVPADFEGELSLRKLDANLSLTWETKMGAEDVYPLSMGYAVQQTADGGYVVAGAAGYNPGGGYTLLLKTDASGEVLWSVLLDGELGTGVRQAADNGYVVSTVGTGGGLLIKTDPGGAWEWNCALAGSGQAVWNSSDGGFAVAGGSAANSGEVLVAKTDAGGTILWEWFSGSFGGDIGYSIQQVSDNGYIVVGAGSDGGANHGFDVYLVKLNGAGDLIWERYFGGTGDDVGRSVWQTSDGGYILAGFLTSAGAGGVDAYLVKTDEAGVPQW
jgi:hypothetical protein